MFENPPTSLLDIEIQFVLFCISRGFNAKAGAGAIVFQNARPGLQIEQ